MFLLEEKFFCYDDFSSFATHPRRFIMLDKILQSTVFMKKKNKMTRKNVYNHCHVFKHSIDFIKLSFSTVSLPYYANINPSPMSFGKVMLTYLTHLHTPFFVQSSQYGLCQTQNEQLNAKYRPKKSLSLQTRLHVTQCKLGKDFEKNIC